MAADERLVKSARAEVGATGDLEFKLENVRDTSRVLKGNGEDPDMDRKVVIEGVPAVTAETDRG